MTQHALNSAATPTNSDFSTYIKSVILDEDYKNYSCNSYTEEEFVESFKSMYTASKGSQIRIFHINIRSLNCNVDNLTQLLTILSVEFDVVVLSEIWCYNLNYYTNAFTGYSFYYDLPDGVTVGGVGIYVSNSLSHRQIIDLKLDNSTNLKVETLWVEITLGKEIITFRRNLQTSIS